MPGFVPGMRKHLLAAALILGSLASPAILPMAPGWAQAPPPVPAEPDAERRTRYTGVSSVTTFPLTFDIYGDGTDFTAWLEVWVNGVNVPSGSNWTLVPNAGSFTTLSRPLLAGNLNVVFNTPQTGTIDIVGARRPRRTSQLSNNAGVTARDFNQVITDLWMTLRETWDRTNDITGRVVIGVPGDNFNPLPPAATRAGQYLCFAAGTGQPTTCAGAQGSGTVAAGNGITFTGSNPTTVSANITAGPGIAVAPVGGAVQVSAGPGTDTNLGRTVTTAPTIATTDCAAPVYLTGNVQYTVAVGAATGFPVGCRLIFIQSETYTGPGSGRGKLMSVNGITNHFLYPGAQESYRRVGSAWVPDQLLNGAFGQLWLVPAANVKFFTDIGGSDTANDGLASGASGAFSTVQRCVTAAYVQVYMLGRQSVISCSNTAGQSQPAAFITAFFQLPNASLTIDSVTPGSQWTWNCPAGLPCLQFGDNFLGGVTDVNAVGSSTSPSLFTGHQFSIIDLINVTVTGASSSTNALDCDSDTHFNISGGFRFTGTMQLIGNACQGSSWKISNGFSASGTAAVTRPFNFFAGSKGTFGGNVTYTNTGATYAGETLISGNSVVNNFGAGTFPGLTGTPTVSTGGQFCNTGTGPC